MSTATETIEDLVKTEYKYGFVTDVETESTPPGLSEETIRMISLKKNEPEWLTDWRLKSYRHWLTMTEPTWQKAHHEKIDYQAISYFSQPKPKKDAPKSLDEVDPKLLETYEKLGIPLRERGRLVDSLIDGHKYAFEKRAIVFGEEDLVIGLTALLCEVGVTPVLCASGGRSGKFEGSLREAAPELPAATLVKEGFDFAEIAEAAPELKPDFLVGSSKGYSIARRLKVPLIRVGFPIHDRMGGQGVLHLGYRGALELYDRIVNALLEVKQETSPVGYSYL